MVVDLFLVFSFIKRLVTPFEKWEAYKEGIIDKDGNVLIKRKDYSKANQKKAFGVFDQLILNIKKLLAKVPGGSSRLGTYAAALWLIKEEKKLEEYSSLNENFNEDAYIVSSCEKFLQEHTDLLEEASKEEEATTVGGGAIAGLGVGPQGEPGVSKANQKKHKKRVKNIIRRT
jgi:hypothetical protein